MKHLKIKIDKYDVDGNEILRNIEFTLNKSDRIAIVGGNGSGKTTILKIITGEIKNFDGIIENIGSVSLGYLAQIYNDNENKTVYEELKDGFADIIVLEKELAILEEELKNGNNPDTLEQYSDKLEHFNNMGGYNYNSILMGVASGLGIVPLLKSPLTQISGGQRTKVALAKILIHSPDILFLDEPTNFIDMASLEWLEYYLQNKWKGGYVIVSHDREFLDKTCEKTYEVQPARALSLYHCNYSEYVVEREKKEKKIQEDFERQDDWIKSQEGLVNRFRAGSRAGWAKSREKMLDKIDRIEPPYIPHKAKFLFNETENTSEKILTFKQVFIG
ncbi:ATP-binding cassette domain-containing protein, partial [Candidatus Gracilibacteria bacterium]|nr:ATP-binding cassette domain-containing protein [Candidatus Gracilibacteria bacterium]